MWSEPADRDTGSTSSTFLQQRTPRHIRCETEYDESNCEYTFQAREFTVEKYPVGDPTIADSILDRLVHNAYRIELAGESMRKKRGRKPDDKEAE